MNVVNFWSPLNYIFFFLSLYFVMLTFFTFYRTYLTTKGLFWGFVLNLFALLTSLILNFNNIFLKQMTFAWSFYLVKPSWAFPEVGLNIYCDNLSFLFILLVSIIGFATNLYILNYFKYEANEDIFILIINWFILSMILLVIANNFFTLFLGWELIGLTSFFLINFWSERRGTLKSSFKAFVFNKVSDFFLFLFIILVWFLTGKSNIFLINAELTLLAKTTDFYWSVAAWSLILCSSIKSAQLIGHLWLPDSMEAPVPASALIHSATLVSAGVYLLLRFSPVINYVDYHSIVIIIGSVTAAYGGIVSASQTDVKKLLAYSTVSHCGFLFVCTGFQNYYLAVIYLFLHGLFKAMTFFCVGSFIRAANSQDTRQMGFFSRYLPVDTIFLIICASNLGGLPFTMGYLYKYLFMLGLMNSKINFLSFGFCFIGMLSSLVYVYRLVYYSAFDFNKTNPNFLLKSLQDNESVEKKYWSASTLAQSFIIFFLLILSLYLYLLFYSYLMHSSLIIEHFPLYFVSIEGDLKTTEDLYLFYTNFFYALYVIVIAVLVIVECRKSYTWQRKIHFIVFLLFFLFSILFLFL